jgi:hypothetical protein
MTEKKQALDTELERRLDEYVDIVKPGSPDSLIPPMTFAQYLPAVVVSVILTILAVVVGFTSY